MRILKSRCSPLGLVLFLLASTAVTTQGTKYGYTVEKTIRGWENMRNYCWNNGMKMAMPQTQEENDELLAFVRENDGFGDFGGILLGIYPQYVQGVFQLWRDINGNIVYWANWGENTTPVLGSNLKMNTDGKWNVVTGDETYTLCQTNKAVVTSTPKYVYTFEQVNRHWYDQKPTCKEIGKSMAMPKTKAQQDELLAYLVDKSQISTGYFILGGYRSGIWLWNDGTPVQYSNWKNGIVPSQNGVIKMDMPSGIWYSVNPVTLSWTLCQEKIPTYTMQRTLYNWDGMKKYCGRFGKTMVMPKTKDQQEELEAFVLTQVHIGSFLLGGYRNGSDPRWFWDDGTPVQYTNWYDGVDLTQNGVIILDVTSGKWIIGPKTDVSYMLCQKNEPVPTTSTNSRLLRRLNMMLS